MFGNRLPIYGLVNLGFIAYISVAGSIGSNANPRYFFLAMLFAICSSPLLLVKKPNDRFATYAVFCGIYFMSFGATDLISLLSAPSMSITSGALSPAEALILLGGAFFSIGYQIAARGRRSPTFAFSDWSKNTLIIVGLLLWSAGTYATWYWNIRLTVRAGEFNNNTGQAVTTILMLGRYAQPLGLLILAYGYTINRSAFLTAVMISLATYQVYLGFVSDTKGGAMLGGIMVIVTGFLVKGSVPKGWAIAGILFIFFAFPVFQAHRMYVVGERGLSNANSADNFGKALQVSVDSQKRAAGEHAESFFERSSVKSAVEMIVTKTGTAVPYQHGHTLLPLAAAFIPRLIWPDKLDIQVGQLVNTEFRVTGERVTYISPSYLGELYWNFGWAGAIGGMLLLGLLLGWINTLCDLSEKASVTRLLVLGITILQLGVRFEASIATEYAVWARSIAAILIMHRVFAPHAAPGLATPSGRAPAIEAGQSSIRFPHLLR